MSTTAPAARTRWRHAAVALVLLTGAGATLATTPPLERCPDPPADGAVSDFYGPQEYETGLARVASPREFSLDGFPVVQTDVSGPACVTADDGSVTVRVDLRLDLDEPGPVPDEVLGTLTVRDGQGRSWSPAEVSARERLAPRSEGGDPTPSTATVTFALPVDVEPPVSLHLGGWGGLDGAPLEELSLDEPTETPP
ncbi:hypothetical protein [Cellulomonas oligotrophica]|nr:hypothetical protein [Cellulomonas oligotrophica]NYD85741.1 hypothetical protein [Cellulomonas oligotrophica]